MNLNELMTINSYVNLPKDKIKNINISDSLDGFAQQISRGFDTRISFLRDLREKYTQAFDGIQADLDPDAIHRNLSRFCRLSFDELYELSPLTLLRTSDQAGFVYEWIIYIEKETVDGKSERCSFSEHLIRQVPGRALYEERWDSRNKAWIGNDPADDYLFDRDLLPILDKPSSARALFVALVTDQNLGFLTSEAWNKVLAANDFLLHLADQLPKDCVEFSSTEVGCCLLPVKKQLVGLGISQYNGKLFLVEHMPERARERILNIDRDSDDTLAETICRVSLKQAQNFLLAQDYPVSDDPDSLSLYLPLSKTRIIYEKRLPLQSTRDAFVAKYKKDSIYQEDEELYLDFFIDFLYGSDFDDYDDDDDDDDDYYER